MLVVLKGDWAEEILEEGKRKKFFDVIRECTGACFC